MNDWIVLPRKLLTEYGKILGAQVIAVYAWLVARADEDYSVTIAYTHLQDLWLTPYKLRKAIAKLETFGLIKRASKSSNRTYHLLWIPSDSWKKFEDADPPYSNVRSGIINNSIDRSMGKLKLPISVSFHLHGLHRPKGPGPRTRRHPS